MSFLKLRKKTPTWWNSTISSEPICKISRWKSNSYYVFISTLAYLLNEEETDQTGRESLQQTITVNGLQLSAKNDTPREGEREGERQTASEGRSKKGRLRDGAQENDRGVWKKKPLKCIELRVGKGEQMKWWRMDLNASCFFLVSWTQLIGLCSCVQFTVRIIQAFVLK